MGVGNNFAGNVVIAGMSPDGKAYFIGVGAPTQASATLTSDNTNVSDGDTVLFTGPEGVRTYVFRTILTGVTTEVQVLIGADADTSLGNLRIEVNAGLHACPYGSFAAVSAHAMVFTASLNYLGSQGNAILVAETSIHLTWGSGVTALSGGAYGGIYTDSAPVGGIPVTGVQEVLAFTTGSSSTSMTISAGTLTVSVLGDSSFAGVIGGMTIGASGAYSASAHPGNTLPAISIVRSAGTYDVSTLRPE